MRISIRLIHCVICSVALFLSLAGTLAAQDGTALFTQGCASCHDGGFERAPDRDALQLMTPERVLAALEGGSMVSMASGRSGADRRAIAEFVTGKPFGEALDTTPLLEANCSATEGDLADPTAGPLWNGWGAGTANTRFQDGPMAGFTATDGAVVWDFDTVRTYDTVNGVSACGGSMNVGGPAISGGMLFVNSGDAGKRPACILSRRQLTEGAV